MSRFSATFPALRTLALLLALCSTPVTWSAALPPSTGSASPAPVSTTSPDLPADPAPAPALPSAPSPTDHIPSLPPLPATPWMAVGEAPNVALLRVPAACALAQCPLVIVSHPRHQTPERLRDSPSVGVLLDELTRASFVILLSHDGGPTSWGSPEALRSVAASRELALRHFAWNGRTYALGISMGGLLALRSALPGSPYRVDGVALIDAWADLRGAWGTSLTRRAEINAAYNLSGPPSPDLDPLPLALAHPPLPLLISASKEDGTVPAETNSDKLFRHARPDLSEYIATTGLHMGGNRFTTDMGRRIAAFYHRLEDHLARR